MRLFSMYGWVRKRHMLGLGVGRFVQGPWVGGVMLLICVVIAMLLANLPATSVYYKHLLETDLSIRVCSPDGLIDWTFPRDMTVEKLINDGLMVIFFFAVGLEIKREIVCGQLSSVRRAILPVFAAAGGMLVPALIYLLFNMGTPAANGWGIPTATDIAFAIGILSMMGDRVPISLKIFLTALAIADDLGAILVIAFFYGGHVEVGWLLVAVAIMLGIYVMNRMGETRMGYYLIPGIVVWSLFYYSGVHSAISGVAMAMLIPMGPRYSKGYFMHKLHKLARSLFAAEDKDGEFPNEEHRFYLRRMSSLASNSVAMSYRLEHALAPYVTFVVMPVFALANAGVPIASAEYLNIFACPPGAGAVGIGVFLGLLVGKPLGIFLASWIAVKSKLAVMPEGATWRMLFAVGCLGGIGFTMSIFVDALAFADVDLIDRGKIAILMGSTAAALLGSLLIILFSAKKTDTTKMKNRILILLAAAAMLSAGCSGEKGGGAKLETDVDSVAYVIGMNVGINLLKMDSTLNVEALCAGIRDVFEGDAHFSEADARTFYLRWTNYALPEKARQYEERFLEDIQKSNRSYARTASGVTYTVEVLGDQEQTASGLRDSVALRYVIRTADGTELYSSYERGDTLSMALGDLQPGVQESVKLIGQGGKIIAWLPAATAYGADGDEELEIQPNATLNYEIELIGVDTYANQVRNRNLR